MQIAVWMLALALSPTLIPQRQLVAEGFSTFVIVLLSLNLVLATRAGVLERGLQGLDKLYVTHRTIGLSVAVLITTHFLLVPKSQGLVASKPFGYATLALLLIAILAASAPRFPWAALVPLDYQQWKFSHRFMGVLVALAVTHSLLGRTYVKTSPLLASYVYGIATIGLIAYAYKELAFARLGPFHRYQVERFRLLGGDRVAEITLTAPSRELRRRAGQFAFVSFSDGPTKEQHPFTISSGSADAVRFSIKGSGDFTEALLDGVPADSAARVEGPYGAFDYRRGTPRQLWLAGGIGITPFLGMAEDLDPGTAVRLIWSVRSGRDAIYDEVLSCIAQDKPGFRYELHTTKDHGHLDVSALELEGDAGEYSAFVCGPLPMRKATVKQLRALGVARARIVFEEFRLR